MQTNKVYSYCRVSHSDQNLSHQINAVKTYAMEHGLTLDDRDGWRLLTEHLIRSQDTLIIKELDRLSRYYIEIKEEWYKLCEMEINIIIIDTPILNTAQKSDLRNSLYLILSLNY